MRNCIKKKKCCMMSRRVNPEWHDAAADRCRADAFRTVMKKTVANRKKCFIIEHTYGVRDYI